LADLSKTAILYGPKDIRIENRTIPELGTEDILIKSTDVSICATEVKYWYKGIPQVPDGTRVVQGHELGGVIEELGCGVNKNYNVGLKVAVDPTLWCGTCDMCAAGMSNLCRHIQFMSLPPVDGGFQQFYRVPAKNVHPVPSSMPSDWVSMAEPVSIGLNAISDAERIIGTLSGKNIAIVGAGSLGLLLIQTLRLLREPHKICILDPLDYRLKLAYEFGADVIINPKTDDPSEGIKEATQGSEVDIVFEVSGESDAYQLSANLVKPNGTIVIIGIPISEHIPIQCITARRHGLTLKFVRRFNPNDFPKAIEMIASGSINVAKLITHTFSLDEITKAFEMLYGYSDGVIKVVIHPHPAVIQ
jgi:L-iditol 2-dehydrogenase